jgi:hypothetical protein
MFQGEIRRIEHDSARDAVQLNQCRYRRHLVDHR